MPSAASRSARPLAPGPFDVSQLQVWMPPSCTIDEPPAPVPPAPVAELPAAPVVPPVLVRPPVPVLPPVPVVETPPSGGGTTMPPSGSAHWPSEQTCAAGHWTPAQPSWHLPCDADHRRRARDLVASLVDAGAARVGRRLASRSSRSGQFRQPQAARQAPPSQTWPLAAGDPLARIDAVSDPADLARRTNDAVTAADADALIADLIRAAVGVHAPRVLAEPVGRVADGRGTAGKLAGRTGADADASAADLPRRTEAGRVGIVDDAVAVVVEEVAGLGPRLDVLPADDRHPAVRALGGAAGADARHHRVAGLSAARAIDAADVKDEVVEVAVVAPVAA